MSDPNTGKQKDGRGFRRLVLLICSLMLLPFLVYGWLLCRYWSNRPILSRNYAAELNAPLLLIPAEERAWTHYRAALVKLEQPPAEWKPDDYHPDAPHWADVAAYLERNQEPLAMLREATALPKLGYLLSDAVPQEDKAFSSWNEAMEPSENPPLILTLLLAAGELRRASKLLSADAHLAAQRNQPQRASDDLTALVAMGDHIRETAFLIADQTSWETFFLALSAAGEILRESPDLWSDEQLARLAARIAAYSDGRIAVRTTGQRMILKDVVQRWYTDDGHGNGHYHALGHALSAGNKPTWSEKFLSPLVTYNVADRRDLMNKLIEIMDRCDVEFARPLWQQSDWSLADEIEPLQRDQRYFLITELFPAIDLTYHQAEETTQHRDALLVVIAMARFRLEHGSWPEMLDALVPRYLDGVPVDRCAGKPFCLQYRDGRPLLYSLGFDGDDDQGEDAFGTYQGSNVVNELIREIGRWELDSLDGDWPLWPLTKPEPILRQAPDGSDHELLEDFVPDP